jgi:hypothetical protein
MEGMPIMSNMGNMGNMGNIGNVAWPSAPDRVEFPFIAERAGDRPVRSLRLAPAQWPERDWSGEWEAWLVLLEFLDARDENGTYKDISLPEWKTGPGLQDELEALANLAEDERADALPEIIAQDGLYVNFLGEFTHLLGISAQSHPNTVKLLHVGGIVGLLVAMRLKEKPGVKKDASGNDMKADNTGAPILIPARPRPSHYLPALRPPVEVPGHASYPSGHALQSALMAGCVQAALNGADNLCALLDVLAFRIARNREIAGLHFRSDSCAGRRAAGKVLKLLKALDDGTRFKTLLREATIELQSFKNEN